MFCCHNVVGIKSIGLPWERSGIDFCSQKEKKSKFAVWMFFLVDKSV
jgi:hypothetical protein